MRPIDIPDDPSPRPRWGEGRTGEQTVIEAKDGGQAFPRSGFEADARASSDFDTPPQEGMSLRDYFAAAALPAAMAVYFAQNDCGCAVDHALRNVPALAYKYADAMIAARQDGSGSE